MLRPTNAGAATSALFEMKKGAAFCDALGWFDAGAPFEGTGVIYMKAPFFPAGPCQAVARFSEK